MSPIRFKSPIKNLLVTDEAGRVSSHVGIYNHGVPYSSDSNVFTVTPTSTGGGVFKVKMKVSVPIDSDALTNTSMSSSAVGSGVTSTFAIHTSNQQGASGVDLAGEVFTTVSTPHIDTDGLLYFYVQFSGPALAVHGTVGNSSFGSILSGSLPGNGGIVVSLPDAKTVRLQTAAQTSAYNDGDKVAFAAPGTYGPYTTFYTVDTVDGTAGTVLFIEDLGPEVVAGKAGFVGYPTLVLSSLVDVTNLTIGQDVYISSTQVCSDYSKPCKVLGVDAGTHSVYLDTYYNQSLFFKNLFALPPYTLALTNVSDAANFVVGSSYIPAPFGTTWIGNADHNSPAVVSSVDTEAGTVTFESYSNVAQGFTLFRNISAYTALRLITSSAVNYVRGI